MRSAATTPTRGTLRLALETEHGDSLVVDERPGNRDRRRPAVEWAVLVELAGWTCPLTPLENHWRALDGGAPGREPAAALRPATRSDEDQGSGPGRLSPSPAAACSSSGPSGMISQSAA